MDKETWFELEYSVAGADDWQREGSNYDTAKTAHQVLENACAKWRADDWRIVEVITQRVPVLTVSAAKVGTHI